MREPPLVAIERLAAEAASGELIIASDAVEIHIYFLEGRLAWATSSTARQAFVAHLVDHHGVAAETVRAVIAECQRARTRLGETLVGWGVASTAQVREALAVQITESLGAAAAYPAADTLFLPRRMAYDVGLTFALRELVAPRGPDTLDERAVAIIGTVLDSIPEASWVEVAGTAGGAGCGVVRPAAPLAALQAALHDQAIDALVVRTSGGVVLGQRLPGETASVWCVAGPDVKLGVASAVLASAVGAAGVAPSATRVEPAWREQPGAGCPAVIAQAMRTTDDLLAGVVIARDGELAGAWRGDEDLADHAARARALAPALAVRFGDDRGPRDAFAYHQVALRAQRGDRAMHGTLLANGAALWLVLPTWTSQGLGWALLQAVARQCADAARGDA